MSTTVIRIMLLLRSGVIMAGMQIVSRDVAGAQVPHAQHPPYSAYSATLKADQIKRAQAEQRAHAQQAELIAQAKRATENNNRERAELMRAAENHNREKKLKEAKMRQHVERQRELDQAAALRAHIQAAQTAQQFVNIEDVRHKLLQREREKEAAAARQAGQSQWQQSQQDPSS